MARETVTLQIGQCGNQIGRRFWYELVHEAAATQRGGRYDVAMSAFFRNVDCRHQPPADLDIGSSLGALRARAVLIDMEEGVVAETMRDSVFGELFDSNHLVTDVSGAGNNWAHGYAAYGRQYGDAICEACRSAVEKCSSPQAFLVLQSVGGGTGSGLGSAVLERLADEFPGLCRLSVPVYPSGDDDVVTSPYNAVLATRKLAQTANCVIPLENDALLDACARVALVQRTAAHSRSNRAQSASHNRLREKKRGFDEINDVAAQFLAHLTAGGRYAGKKSINMRELAHHLVPLPGLCFVAASFAPVLPRGQTRHEREDYTADASLKKTTASSGSSSIKRLFDDACSPRSRLVRLNSREHLHFSHRATTPNESSLSLASAILARGDLASADLDFTLHKIRDKFKFPWWNSSGFVVSNCAVPPLVPALRAAFSPMMPVSQAPRSVRRSLPHKHHRVSRIPRRMDHFHPMSRIVAPLKTLRSRFLRLYQRKAMVHHYTQFIDTFDFDEALDMLEDIIDGYERTVSTPRPSCHRPQSAVLASMQHPTRPNLHFESDQAYDELSDMPLHSENSRRHDSVDSRSDPPTPPPPAMDEEEERRMLDCCNADGESIR